MIVIACQPDVRNIFISIIIIIISYLIKACTCHVIQSVHHKIVISYIKLLIKIKTSDIPKK